MCFVSSSQVDVVCTGCVWERRASAIVCGVFTWSLEDWIRADAFLSPPPITHIYITTKHTSEFPRISSWSSISWMFHCFILFSDVLNEQYVYKAYTWMIYTETHVGYMGYKRETGLVVTLFYSIANIFSGKTFMKQKNVWNCKNVNVQNVFTNKYVCIAFWAKPFYKLKFYNQEFDNIQSVILQTIIDYALNILRTPIQNGCSQLNRPKQCVSILTSMWYYSFSILF